jgi:DNA (cytosine-5)-methyltransferase 1
VNILPAIEPAIPIKDILETEPVGEEYFLREEDMPKWVYAKGPKHELRTKRNGSQYWFNEGTVQFPEPLDKPSRTMLTSESEVGRTSHVVTDLTTDRLRTITPRECERLNGFPDDWTDTGMTIKQRYFCMGNALVVPIIKRIASHIR